MDIYTNYLSCYKVSYSLYRDKVHMVTAAAVGQSYGKLYIAIGQSNNQLQRTSNRLERISNFTERF